MVWTVHAVPTGVVIGIAVLALTAMLGASEVLVRGVGRLARNQGLLGGIVGLLIALGADSPEISSAVASVANGSAATAVGVVIALGHPRKRCNRCEVLWRSSGLKVISHWVRAAPQFC